LALILDTNAVSAFAEGDVALGSIIATQPDLAIPVIVLGEYLSGIRQSKYRKQYESWLQATLPSLHVLTIGRETASEYAEVYRELKAVGRPIPTNDMWIAALAREYRLPLLTRDQHFRAVAGVRLITW